MGQVQLPQCTVATMKPSARFGLGLVSRETVFGWLGVVSGGVCCHCVGSRRLVMSPYGWSLYGPCREPVALHQQTGTNRPVRTAGEVRKLASPSWSWVGSIMDCTRNYTAPDRAVRSTVSVGRDLESCASISGTSRWSTSGN